MPHKKGTKLGLKANSKRILDIIASQPKQNATKAYMEVHPEASPVTARNNASQLLKKPEAQIYLQKHIDKAKETVVQLMNSSKKDEIRLNASKDILDREYGKATQRTEIKGTIVSVQMDLTSTVVQDT